MKQPDQIELTDGTMVHVIEEIYGIRYSGDRFVLGLILGFDEISEAEVTLVECELCEAESELFRVMDSEPREINLTTKAFDRMVELVTAFRAGTLDPAVQ